MDLVTWMVIGGAILLWVVGMALWRRFGARLNRKRPTDAAANDEREVREERLRAEQRLRDEHHPGALGDHPRM